MKTITIINRIEKLIDSMNYKTAYIEIQTDKEKYTLEQEKRNQIGFRSKLDEH